MERRIHIFGASGAGTTTLGRLLSERLEMPHFDTDDYFWAESEIPYTKKREEEERKSLLKSDLTKSLEWVLSGSLVGWGDFAIPMFTLAVFLWIPADIRICRLKTREMERYGTEAISPGGWFYENSKAFIEWASQYDSGGMDMRSRALHEQWMKNLPCGLLRIEEALPVEEFLAIVENELGNC